MKGRSTRTSAGTRKKVPSRAAAKKQPGRTRKNAAYRKAGMRRIAPKAVVSLQIPGLPDFPPAASKVQPLQEVTGYAAEPSGYLRQSISHKIVCMVLGSTVAAIAVFFVILTFWPKTSGANAFGKSVAYGTTQTAPATHPLLKAESSGEQPGFQEAPSRDPAAPAGKAGSPEPRKSVGEGIERILLGTRKQLSALYNELRYFAPVTSAHMKVVMELESAGNVARAWIEESSFGRARMPFQMAVLRTLLRAEYPPTGSDAPVRIVVPIYFGGTTSSARDPRAYLKAMRSAPEIVALQEISSDSSVFTAWHQALAD